MTSAGHRRANSHYYLGWVAARLPDLRNQHQQVVQAEIHREVDNIRAAWRWAVAHSNVSALGEAGGALLYFYWMRSWFQEGAELFHLAATRCEPLAAVGESTATHAWVKLLAPGAGSLFTLGNLSLPTRSLHKASHYSIKMKLRKTGCLH